MSISWIGVRMSGANTGIHLTSFLEMRKPPRALRHGGVFRGRNFRAQLWCVVRWPVSSRNFGEELLQLVLVQLSIGAHATANIEGEGPYVAHRLPNVLRSEPAGQKHRDIYGDANARTDAPIVDTPGAAQFFDRR